MVVVVVDRIFPRFRAPVVFSASLHVGIVDNIEVCVKCCLCAHDDDDGNIDDEGKTNDNDVVDSDDTTATRPTSAATDTGGDDAGNAKNCCRLCLCLSIVVVVVVANDIDDG